MLYDCRTAADRDRGVEAAVDAVKRGDLIVMPTDTLYGIGADAFKPWAVTALLDAKGRDRQMPPPVLVGTRATLDGLVYNLPSAARDLVEALQLARELEWAAGEAFAEIIYGRICVPLGQVGSGLAHGKAVHEK